MGIHLHITYLLTYNVDTRDPIGSKNESSNNTLDVLLLAKVNTISKITHDPIMMEIPRMEPIMIR